MPLPFFLGAGEARDTRICWCLHQRNNTADPGRGGAGRGGRWVGNKILMLCVGVWSFEPREC